MRRVLSSSRTPFEKFGSIIFFGFAFTSLLYCLGAAIRNPSDGNPAGSFLFPAIAMLIVATFLLFYNCRLKRVVLLDDRIEVSNYIRKCTIAYADVDDLREYNLLAYTYVTLLLRQPCRLGGSVSFIARMMPLRSGQQHPDTLLLRKLMGSIREPRASPSAVPKDSA